jgi:hypothetical protein
MQVFIYPLSNTVKIIYKQIASAPKLTKYKFLVPANEKFATVISTSHL